ncbi:MAG: ABC transporter ATP-binding protein [Actinomycetaceae bacterium]|nr:ABC transporter ATP-binding protein [Actinomycetaceae bacterium]
MNTSSLHGELAIEARALTRTYRGKGKEKGFTAVDGIDLDVRRGEIFALLGTNGAGKTSTMEVLEGLAPGSSGRVTVFGLHPIEDRSILRPHQGIMLQEGGFSRDLTVEETMRMWTGTLSRPAAIGEVLESVDLAHRSSVRIASLSGGERRRLDLACALAGRPSLLFLDEPTTGLDPESRVATWDLLREQNAKGTTIVLTTHYLEEAEALADRLAIMHESHIVRSGNISEVIEGHMATISFATLDRALPGPLGELATVDGAHTSLRTPRLQDTLTALLDWARAQGVVLRNLKAHEASLESVFLSIAAERI